MARTSITGNKRLMLHDGEDGVERLTISVDYELTLDEIASLATFTLIDQGILTHSGGPAATARAEVYEKIKAKKVVVDLARRAIRDIGLEDAQTRVIDDDRMAEIAEWVRGKLDLVWPPVREIVASREPTPEAPKTQPRARSRDEDAAPRRARQSRQDVEPAQQVSRPRLLGGVIEEARGRSRSVA